jgi:hypothetical protein
MHAERGREGVEHIVRFTAGHDINHIRQIELLVKPKGSSDRYGGIRSLA